jgi:hypothetical protein
VNELVAACRREWRRLRVPAEEADEMAAELEADLADAAADGLTAADVLGGEAADPLAFARAWATERGLVATRPRRLPLALGAAAVLAAILTGVALLAGGRTPHVTRTPDVVGLTRQAAAGRAEAAGLRLRVVRGQVSSPVAFSVTSLGAAAVVGRRQPGRSRTVVVVPASVTTLSGATTSTTTFTYSPGSVDVLAQLPAAGSRVSRGGELQVLVGPSLP